LQSSLSRILFNGREIPRAGKEYRPGGAVSWATDDATGSILIFIPQSVDRSFDVEFFAEAK